MKDIVLILVIFVVLIGGGYFLMNRNSTSNQNASVENTMPAPDSQGATEMVVKEEDSAMEDVKEFTMTAKQWFFEPSEIRIKQGNKVKLTIKSIDVTHGFALPDFGVKVDLQPNIKQTVEFIADKQGEFTFFCSVYCGQGHSGMKGKLIVE